VQTKRSSHAGSHGKKPAARDSSYFGPQAAEVLQKSQRRS
jgi:hypothetical protein